MSCEKSTDAECETKAGASPRPGGPEWGPRPGRGAGRYGGERGERGDAFRGGWGPAARAPRRALAAAAGRRDVPGGRRLRARTARGRPGGPGDPGFGPVRPVRPRRGFGRGMRARKGDVRAAILDLFAEERAGRGTATS